ncbi:macrolide transport system ATP-binding/permease protein [Paenibacillus sp. UNCCL117]|uniref:ribosomal protection-like ABC-F family protein n=1 Tax=unclassified Paenibacillus TaxID=185978 RepID=UPI00088142CD|nr:MULTISPECIES: ABC-F family ATP-binding cassette domain-containing protein [unclassified Paenibacillus]SDD77541.1 macrolide transport system ATP-binding/permease protein [Paenibacillus sp. cl123]SFW52753.1 macrolide transport system ATP-binding/permease protein [Paenibacillus sp. UNCCL117]
MRVIAFEEVAKLYGDHSVLDKASFYLTKGERVALVGENGAGKSTLLKLAAGLEEPDEGTVTTAPHVRVGYLPQTVEVSEEQTVDKYLEEALGEIRRLQAEMVRQTEAMSGMEGKSGEEGRAEAALKAYGQAAERFEALGGYEAEYRTSVAMEGLGLGRLSRDRRVGTLSGGEKRRLALAALLASSPECMLLDEPTNHLDEQSLHWLERYLSGYRGTVLYASHDRLFINRTATGILEIDEATRRCSSYAGNYEAYREKKRQERLRWQEAYEREQQEIRELRRQVKETAYLVGHNRPATDPDKFVKHFAGERVQRRISQNIRSAEKKLERIESNPVAKPPEPLSFRVRLEREGSDLSPWIRADGVAYTAEESGGLLLEGLTFCLEGEERLLVAGPNGSGKTTLLRLLTGELQPSRGTVEISSGARIGYWEQEPALTPEERERTVLELYRYGRPGFLEDHTRELLDTGLFGAAEFSRRVSELSPGQLRKLLLARLIAARPDILLLDEPTNHLSLELVEQLEQAIRAFPGPVLVVSHDRWLIDRFTGGFLYLTPGNRFSSD